MDPTDVQGIDHIGIFTRDFDQVTHLFGGVLGAEVSEPEEAADLGREILWVRLGGVALEFIRALDAEGPAAERLASEGPGVHHIAVRVRDAEGALRAVVDAGIGVVDQTPRAGVRGSQIAFLERSDVGGTVVELVQPQSTS